jgi:hypothetical protein
MNQLGTFHDMHPTLTSLQILEVHWISHFCFRIQTIFVPFMFEIIYFGTQTCLASQLLASSFFFVFKRRCDRLLVNLVGVGIGNLPVFFFLSVLYLALIGLVTLACGTLSKPLLHSHQASFTHVIVFSWWGCVFSILPFAKISLWLGKILLVWDTLNFIEKPKSYNLK